MIIFLVLWLPLLSMFGNSFDVLIQNELRTENLSLKSIGVKYFSSSFRSWIVRTCATLISKCIRIFFFFGIFDQNVIVIVIRLRKYMLWLITQEIMSKNKNIFRYNSIMHQFVDMFCFVLCCMFLSIQEIASSWPV